MQIAVNAYGGGIWVDLFWMLAYKPFHSLSSPGWVATARWTSGAGAMEKPECFQFLENDEMRDRLEQHMKDALNPYSGGPSLPAPSTASPVDTVRLSTNTVPV